jgi:hypothetical protein
MNKGRSNLFSLHLDWAMMEVDIENAFNNFFELLFLENYVMLGAFNEHCPLYQVVLWHSFFFLLLAPTWTTCGKVTIIKSTLGTKQGDPLGGLLFVWPIIEFSLHMPLVVSFHP